MIDFDDPFCCDVAASFPVEGFSNLWFDQEIGTYYIQLEKENTYVEVSGENKREIAEKIHDFLFPETPADVKSVY